MVPALTPAGTADRDDAAAFAGRVARWDPRSPVRLRRDGAQLRMWGTTPFDTLVTRAIAGSVEPADMTVYAGNLLAALAVGTGSRVDPGPVDDLAWRGPLPPLGGWVTLDRIPADVLAELARTGVSTARDRPGPAGGASTALLDSEAMSVSGAGYSVALPMRMLFAMSGMAFAPADADETVRVAATDAWVRLDGRYGSAVRRRHSLLPLLFSS